MMHHDFSLKENVSRYDFAIGRVFETLRECLTEQ